ncbi:hypothetical protein J1614_011088 [Plenodomus biglobosus]|nr:hypothetical protein J1614_011088 [Plenodomus biglobosus]
MKPASEPSSAIEHFSISNFVFHNGTSLPEVRLAYTILNPQNTKVAVVHTCFRGRVHGTLTHAAGALKDHKVIVIALFGNGESSSPSNTPNFPDTVEYIDCVEAERQLLNFLDVKEIDVMMGFSMAGQLTYHWLVTHPSYVKNAVIVCSAAKTSRHNIQFLEAPKAALKSAATPALGLRAFVKGSSAWVTSPQWFEQELYKNLGATTQAEWDDVAAGGNYDDWAPGDLLALTGMWQRGDITRCVPDMGEEKKLEHALQKIEANVLLMPCVNDQYFKSYVSPREAQHIHNAQVATIDSVWGHLAGSGASAADTQWMSDKISAFLAGNN